MVETDWTLVLTIVGVSVAAALGALLVLPAVAAALRLRPAAPDGPGDACVFLFEKEALLDATAPAAKLLATGPEGLSDWDRLCAVLAPRFGDVRGRLASIASEGRIAVEAVSSPPATVAAQWREGAVRVAVAEGVESPAEVRLEASVHHAIFSELASLRRIAAACPGPAWTLDGDGEVAWANRAYIELVQRARGLASPPVWPLPRLFAEHDGADAARVRAALELADQTAPIWFEVFSMGDAGHRVAFALPADEVVRAETALATFRQTLTKTFAHLSVGVAIFDRARHLMIFNPALTDLTRLAPDFLSAQPKLSAFLDRLRETQMIPERRDYRSWRQQMMEIEEAAGRSTFLETWSLPTGQTFRVSGLPQPDGAIAFLFEDISAEIAITRRYRQELEIGQAAIDAVPEAIAVFSPAGILMLSNRAYVELWGRDPGTSLSEIDIAEAARLWREQCRSDLIWSELEDFVNRVGTREALSGRAATLDGAPMTIRAVALAGGATLIGFSFRADQRPEAGSFPALTGETVRPG